MGTLKTDFGIRWAELSLKIACSCALFLCCRPLSAGAMDYLVSQAGPNNSSATVDQYAYNLDGFDLRLLQPDNPPGAQVDSGAGPIVGHRSLSDPFSVDFTWIGPGSPLDPGASLGEVFLIKQYGNSSAEAPFQDLACSVTGTTASLAAGTAAELSGSSPGLEQLVAWGVVVAAGRRRLRTAWQESK